MYRKHNPWVSLLAVILLVGIIAAMMTGCTPTETEYETADEAPLDFTIERSNADVGFGAGVYIITDTKTGDRYMFVKAGYGGGLTKMED